MFRRIVIAGLGPHATTALDVPQGSVEFAGPSESGKSTLIDALCWGMWGVGRDGRPLPAALFTGVATVELSTATSTFIRRRTEGGTSALRVDGNVVGSQRDMSARLKGAGDAAKVRPIMVPFGWLDLVEGPGSGRPFREWLVEHLNGPDLDSVLSDLRTGEAEGDDHAARVKSAEKAATAARKVLQRQQGALGEAEAVVVVEPQAPSPERIAELTAIAARVEAQRQAQSDARAAVKAWDTASRARRDSEDRRRKHDDALAQLVEPKEARVDAALMTQATEAKIRTADTEAACRRTKADLDADLGRCTREIDALKLDLQRLPTAGPDATPCPGVAVTKCKVGQAATAAAEATQARREQLAATIATLQAHADSVQVLIGEASDKVQQAADLASAARETFLGLQDVVLKWTKYDAAASKVGTAPELAPDPGPRPTVPDVEDLPADADAVLKHELNMGFHRRDLARRAERIADLTTAVRLATEAVARAEHVLEIVRSAPGKVLQPRLAGLELGPVSIEVGEDGDSIAVLVDGRPWRCASRGRQVVADAWLRCALRTAVWRQPWLPIIVDEVESVTGARQTLPPGPLWLLRSTPGAALTVRGLES